MLKILRDDITPERKREHAYHEAGHVAILFMFGRAFDINHIDMRGNLDLAASINVSNVYSVELIENALRDNNTQRCLQLGVKQDIMFGLAGYAAGNRLKEPDDTDWLDQLIKDDEWEVEGHDIFEVIRTANSLWGEPKDGCICSRGTWSRIRRLAAWTDEALSHPRLWAVVEALAEQLQTVKTRMFTRRICHITRTAWGDLGFPPYRSMGPKWRRRFSLPERLRATSSKPAKSEKRTRRE
jgi:hypothetical protein